MKPQTIQIFLPDGNPSGIKIADLTNRLVVATYIPRKQLTESAGRDEIKRYGLYFLFDVNEDKSKPIAYIGETDDCFERLKSHNRNKDFWSYAIAITTKSNTFTKSHVKYLEYLAVKTAKEVNRFELANLTVPAKEHISESMEADLLDNFESIRVLLSTLGFPIFDALRDSTQPKEILICKGRDALAKGELTDNGFLVFKHSTANLEETRTAGDWIVGMREKLLRDGILIREENVYRFTEDFVFRSPSAAAGAVLARRANGWVEWKNTDGKTINDIYRAESIAE